MIKEDPIVAFARDFSGNDAEIVDKARAYVAAPPTAIETVGFYGSDATPARRRAFLATVTLLDNAGKFQSVEDKYSYEIFPQWAEAGIVDPATLPPRARDVFGPFFGDSIPIDGDEPDAAYVETVWTNYAEATQELEEHISSRGKVLLSIDATDGDTLFFAVVDPAIAERWRDRALSEEGGYFSGVRAPMWDRFWNHMDYAAGPYFVRSDRTGYPAGLTQRSNNIPFAQ